MKVKLKQQGPIRINGVEYDLTHYNEEKLQMVYDNNPQLRHLFEVIIEEIIETVVDFIEDKAKDFFKHKPEDKTEEEFFTETIKEVVSKDTLASRVVSPKKKK